MGAVRIRVDLLRSSAHSLHYRSWFQFPEAAASDGAWEVWAEMRAAVVSQPLCWSTWLISVLNEASLCRASLAPACSAATHRSSVCRVITERSLPHAAAVNVKLTFYAFRRSKNPDESGRMHSEWNHVWQTERAASKHLNAAGASCVCSTASAAEQEASSRSQRKRRRSPAALLLWNLELNLEDLIQV